MRLYPLEEARRRAGLSIQDINLLGQARAIPVEWSPYGFLVDPGALRAAVKADLARSFPNASRRARINQGLPPAKLRACEGQNMDDTPGALTLSAEHEAKAAKIQAQLGIDIRPTLLAAKAAGRLEPYTPPPLSNRQRFRQIQALRRMADDCREDRPDLSDQLLAYARLNLKHLTQDMAAQDKGATA